MSNQKTIKNKIICSFCNSEQEKIDFLVEGNGAYICDFCIEKAYEALLNNEPLQPSLTSKSMLIPNQIKEKLDEYIIGQDKAKIILSVAVYNHYKRITNNISSDVIIDKSNILLAGPTGTGKTLLARTLATILDVPFTIVDATVLTEAGYVGEDVENILVRLYHNSDYNVDRTEKGIIYIDEIDKIARKNSNPSITRDVSGEGVQQSLLKIIEGTIANIPPKGGRKHPEQPLVKIDTSNILFICGGTFDGIENVIDRRVRGGGIGFDREVNQISNKNLNIKNIQVEDIIKFGFLPELIGRLPIISHLDYLDKKALLNILTKPKNCIVNQYVELFKIDNIALTFDKDALDLIVEKAEKRKIGARALRSIIEEVMIDIMYDIPSKKNIKSCTITKAVIQKTASPKLQFYKKIA